MIIAEIEIWCRQTFQAWSPLALSVFLKSFVVAALAAGLVYCLKRASSAMRHLCWTGAVVLVLCMPLGVMMPPLWEVGWLPEWTASSQSRSTISHALGESAFARAQSKAIESAPESTVWEGAAAGVDQPLATRARLESAGIGDSAGTIWWWPLAWVTGVLGVWMVMGTGWLQLGRLRRRSRAVTDTVVLEMLEELRLDFGLRRDIHLKWSDEVSMPFTWGWYRPVILLPSTFFEWREDRQRMVLSHEMAHVWRGDWLTQVMGQLACGIHWFNPLVWLAARGMRSEQETACDDLVLVAGSGPTTYAQELLAIARGMGESRSTAWSCGVPMVRPSALEARMKAILDPCRPRRSVCLKHVLGLAICLAGLVVAVGGLQAIPAPQELLHPGAETVAPTSARSDASLNQTSIERGTISSEISELRLQVRSMSEEDVAALRRAVEEDPKDWLARRRLIIYDDFRGEHGAAAEGILHLIKNHPRDPLLATHYGVILQRGNSGAYETGKEMYLAYLREHPEDLDLIDNAANYFKIHDPELGVAWVRRAGQLEPGQAWWPYREGLLLNMLANRAYTLDSGRTNAVQRARSLEALEALERAYTLRSDSRASSRSAVALDHYKQALLPVLAKTAMAAGNLEKAVEYARECLKHASKGGDFYYTGHTVLGQAALANGNEEEAVERLLASAQTTGSPTMNSFGPNMVLAKSLLEAGRTNVVLSFFDRCGQFWDNAKLEEWKEDVSAHRSPDFGANLFY